MTPADLATTVHEATVKVLSDHNLDASVVPDAVTVERPRNPEHGDYATNIALQVAKKAGTNPRELAQWLADALLENPAIAEADVAGPGFLNLRLATDAQGQLVADILAAGETFGNSSLLDGQASASTSNSSRRTQPARSTLAGPAGQLWATRLAAC